MEDRKGAAVKRQLGKTENDSTIIIPLARNAISRYGFRCIALVKDRLQWHSMLSAV